MHIDKPNNSFVVHFTEALSKTSFRAKVLDKATTGIKQLFNYDRNLSLKRGFNRLVTIGKSFFDKIKDITGKGVNEQGLIIKKIVSYLNNEVNSESFNNLSIKEQSKALRDNIDISDLSESSKKELLAQLPDGAKGGLVIRALRECLTGENDESMALLKELRASVQTVRASVNILPPNLGSLTNEHKQSIPQLEESIKKSVEPLVQFYEYCNAIGGVSVDAMQTIDRVILPTKEFGKGYPQALKEFFTALDNQSQRLSTISEFQTHIQALTKKDWQSLNALTSALGMSYVDDVARVTALNYMEFWNPILKIENKGLYRDLTKAIKRNSHPQVVLKNVFEMKEVKEETLTKFLDKFPEEPSRLLAAAIQIEEVLQLNRAFTGTHWMSASSWEKSIEKFVNSEEPGITLKDCYFSKAEMDLMMAVNNN